LPLGATTNKTFQYTVRDVSGALANATVTLTITGQNSTPVAANDTIIIGEKAGTVIITPQMLLNDYDVDAGEQQSLSVSVINTTGTSGIVSLLAGDTVSYNRNGAFGNLAPGVTVNTTFGYTLRDVHNATSSATVTLTIVGANDAPVAQDDVITLTEMAAPTNVTARLLANDSDPDPGHTATLIVSGIDTANTLGSVLFTNQSVSYSPNGQFSHLTNGQSATDSFIYFITDTNGATASAVRPAMR
jgi:VCBS repeat-containing protein